MRLFLSCFISKDISNYIQRLATELPRDAKLYAPHNIDFTIKFLGDVQDDKLDEIKKRLKNIKFKPFRAMLNGIGVFSEDFIRVVWAGVTPSEKFDDLHKQADKALEGIVPKEKRFKAHLTIARVKYVEDKEKFLEALKKIKVKPKTFEVNKLILFKSKLSPKGATHTPILDINAS